MAYYLQDLSRRSVQVSLLLVFVGLLILPQFLSDYRLHIAIVSFYYIMLVSTWNLVAGYTGQFSLATHTFATLGGYTSGLMIKHLGVSMMVGIIAAPFVTFFLGLLMGILVLRMRALYLAIATWAFAESFRILITANFRFTRGDAGLSLPPLFGTLDPLPYYYLFLGLSVVLLFIMYLIVKLPTGSFMRTIRDDELAAAAMGVDTVKWKLFIFSVTSGMAGLIGVFYAHYIALISPVTMQFQEMGKIVIMAITGGMGTFVGPIIGSPLVQILSEAARDFGEWRMVVFSLIVIILMRFERGGVLSLTQKAYRAVRGGAAASS